MIKLLTVEDYKQYQEGMNKILHKMNEDLGLSLHIYHCDNAYVFENAELTKEDVVLDIGCGAGSSTVQAAHFAKEAIGIDREECHHDNYKAYKTMGIHNVQFDCPQDAKNLRYPDSYFDKIISVSAIEHNNQADRMKIIKECARVLKPGGILTMSAGVGVGYIESEIQILCMVDEPLRIIPDRTINGWRVGGWSYNAIYKEWMDHLGYDQGWIPCGFKAIKQ